MKQGRPLVFPLIWEARYSVSVPDIRCGLGGEMMAVFPHLSWFLPPKGLVESHTQQQQQQSAPTLSIRVSFYRVTQQSIANFFQNLSQKNSLRFHIFLPPFEDWPKASVLSSFQLKLERNLTPKCFSRRPVVCGRKVWLFLSSSSSVLFHLEAW